MLTKSDLLKFFIYDPETGLFSRRIDWYGVRAGTVVGADDGAGYVQIGVKGKVYRAHRLAWLYMTGDMPPKVDHKNGVRSDNRWCNLQKADDSENAQNKGGVAGVSFIKASNSWAARMQLRGKTYHFGCYKDRELAELVASEARAKYFNEFYRGKHA